MNLTIEIPDELTPALRRQSLERGESPERFVSRVLESVLVPPTAEPAVSKPFTTGFGMWAKYGAAPSADEIDANRREMFRNVAQDF